MTQTHWHTKGPRRSAADRAGLRPLEFRQLEQLVDAGAWLSAKATAPAGAALTGHDGRRDRQAQDPMRARRRWRDDGRASSRLAGILPQRRRLGAAQPMSAPRSLRPSKREVVVAADGLLEALKACGDGQLSIIPDALSMQRWSDVWQAAGYLSSTLERCDDRGRGGIEPRLAEVDE